LGDAAALPVKSFVKHFRDEFQYHIDHKRCMVSVPGGYFTARAAAVGRAA
jgi:NADH-quinone oxidoreductase subunit F